MVRYNAKHPAPKPDGRIHLPSPPRQLHNGRLAGRNQASTTDIEQHMKLTKEFFERTFGAL